MATIIDIARKLDPANPKRAVADARAYLEFRTRLLVPRQARRAYPGAIIELCFVAGGALLAVAVLLAVM